MHLKHFVAAACFACLPFAGQANAAVAPDPGQGGESMLVQADKVREVTGKVISAVDREPIPGAFVVEKGTNNGVMTMDDGSYVIYVTSANPQLEISCIGFKTGTYDVGKLGVVDVALESDSELDEAVVVGMGTQKKISVIGAVASVQGEAIKSSSSNLTSNLAGKLAGIVSVTNSGEPGSSSEFYIRGVSTFGGRTTPLILLDDVEISVGDLNRLPAESIKNVTLLKDASATAIYGVRGANGVMLITTKNGAENMRTQVTATVETSFKQPVKMVNFVDGGRWMELYNEASLTRGAAVPTYSAQDIEYTRSGLYPYVYPNVDWKEVLFRKFNLNQRGNVSIQGGGNKATYYMSLNFNHDTGMANAPKDYMFNNNLHQYIYNFQNNITYKLTNTTKLDLRLNVQIVQKQGMQEGESQLFGYLLRANPVMFPATFPAQEGDEYIRFGTAMKTAVDRRLNPYAAMLDDYSVKKENKMNAVLKIEQDFSFITKGLSASAMVNWNSYATSTYKQTINPYYFEVDKSTWSPEDPDNYTLEQVGDAGDTYVSEAYDEPSTDQVFYFDARLNYSRKFGRHNVGALLMYMMRDYRPNKSLSERNQGLSGRATYDFDERYFFEFNFGYNGTERLQKGRRFEFFPAVSVGWALSNEKFWEPISNAVNYFKLRGSYGLVGSDDFNYYEHFVYFDQITINGGGTAYFGPSKNNPYSFRAHAVDAYQVDNPHWERSRKLDVGLDFSLFNQVNVTLDYFHEKRDRIMMERTSWPTIAGYWNATPWGQVGAATNEGFEASINWARNFGQDWRLEMRFNMTYNQNRIDAYEEPAYPEPWRSRIGYPLDGYYQRGYIAEGLFTSQEDIDNHAVQQLGSTPMPGDVKYRDVNGDGVINDIDKVQISKYGNLPRLQYGIGLSLGWKKWDLGLYFTGSGMRTIMISGITPFGEDACNVIEFIDKNHWTEADPNPDAAYPRLGINKADVAQNLEASTYWMRNGRFLRFKTLELGYSFKIARVYINGDNLAVWSPFKEWDPELSWNSYPFSRTFTLGVQFKF